ncbi:MULTISPECIES: hypothetical protein [unclassified Variovorax]|uniref:hypothetical protein n=1 Tax=unclassified Variovorax TaxID=663243 RepID=UPI00118054C5|nr:hypothetical protein [Variovorax sp. YR752]
MEINSEGCTDFHPVFVDLSMAGSSIAASQSTNRILKVCEPEHQIASAEVCSKTVSRCIGQRLRRPQEEGLTPFLVAQQAFSSY